MENLDQLEKTVEERSATVTFSIRDTTPGDLTLPLSTVLNYQRGTPLPIATSKMPPQN